MNQYLIETLCLLQEPYKLLLIIHMIVLVYFTCEFQWSLYPRN